MVTGGLGQGIDVGSSRTRSWTTTEWIGPDESSHTDAEAVSTAAPMPQLSPQARYNVRYPTAKERQTSFGGLFS